MIKRRFQAQKNLGRRLRDIDQLLAAYKRTGRGRPSGVDAINRAAFVLGVAHLQGFIDDLFDEIGYVILGRNGFDPKIILEQAKPSGNRTVKVINDMFACLGIDRLMDRVSWQKCSSSSVKRRLEQYIQLRNKIAHGLVERVTKRKVRELKNFLERFSKKVIEVVSTRIPVVSKQSTQGGEARPSGHPVRVDYS